MQNKSTRTLKVAALVVASLLPRLTPAQTIQGRVNGTVTDSAGKVVAAAQITLKNLDAGAERRTTSSDVGEFVLPSVQPGRYSLIASAPGFQQYVVPEFRLVVNESRTLDVQLVVGAVTQTVEVQASTVALNTTDATIGTVIQHQNIVEM
ncbi:MAG: carboxypeptidase-like regulatory domain-containing protein, partial [Bryobacteraceae bacterium]